ncbi:T9SS type A sorting domain-containing protein [Salibacteraceae bacterium]|nr:T9SS type A sorting domain-containing protein [Salibacteraceae bacterium]MDB9709178.1 T9SS type A sorting domain-containing protein [Salibacteraceae bacterium]MDC1303890.1 T9SS type A sorting domain-containing protein [Salibacteraceae bacterium]
MKLITILKYALFSLIISLGSIARSQNALHFDGVNDVVQTAYAGVLGSANRTFEAWVNVSPTAVGNNAIIDYGTNAVGSRNTFNVSGNNGLSFISGGTNANIGTPINAITLGQWTHVAFVLDNGTGYLYVNGVQEGTGSLSTVNTPSGNANMTIGERVSGGSIPFDGFIDEVRIWDYARTQVEIANDMNNEFCTPPPGLVSYFKLNQGIAQGVNTGLTSAIDAVNSAQNGTLNGFALTGTSSNWVIGYGLIQGATFGSITTSACGGLTSPSGNYYYSTPGTYTDTISNAFGCDSIITINLTSVSPNSFSSITPSACNSFVSPSGNYVYTNSGTYLDTLQSASGCDSIITINLSILESFDTIDVDGCYGLTSPSGNYYWTSPGTYQDTITNASGCDSILTINLSILGFTSASSEDTTCFEFISPSGKVWSEPGTFIDTITNLVGCDSIITFQITITGFDLELSNLSGTLVASVTNGSYQWIDCQTGALISSENDRTFRPNSSGQYAAIVEKDGCIDTSSCEEVVVVGEQYLENSNVISVYPNPFNKLLTVRVNSEVGDTRLTILDMSGRTIQMNSARPLLLSQGENQFDLNFLAPGNYVLRVNDKRTSQFIPIVKIQ